MKTKLSWLPTVWHTPSQPLAGLTRSITQLHFAFQDENYLVSPRPGRLEGRTPSPDRRCQLTRRGRGEEFRVAELPGKACGSLCVGTGLPFPRWETSLSADAGGLCKDAARRSRRTLLPGVGLLSTASVGASGPGCLSPGLWHWEAPGFPFPLGERISVQ